MVEAGKLAFASAPRQGAGIWPTGDLPIPADFLRSSDIGNVLETLNSFKFNRTETFDR
jgi:hypothetical protein